MNANGLPPITPQMRALLAHGQQEPQQGEQQPQPPPTPEQVLEQELEKILGGELPGAGYLYPDTPEKRQANLIKTTPDAARDALLSAVEVCAQDAMLPYGQTPKSDAAKAALEYAQAYLLLDPTVDESGIPVGAQALAQGQAQQGVALAQGEAGAHVARESAAADAQHDPEKFSRKPGEPPRLLPNLAEERIEAENEGKSEKLRGARGDRPLPKPRPGS